jgi:hypothetical protein
MHTPSTRLVAFGAFAALCLGAVEVQAENLNTADFIASCAKDPVVTEDPTFAEAKVTPEAYCQCVAGKLEESNVPQTDVDMLVKMHNEDITDADADDFPKLDDLLVANEGYEDACRQSLGISLDDSDEEFPTEEEIPDEGMTEDDEAPADAPPDGADEPQE